MSPSYPAMIVPNAEASNDVERLTACGGGLHRLISLDEPIALSSPVAWVGWRTRILERML
jgi:hypothetical protein